MNKSKKIFVGVVLLFFSMSLIFFGISIAIFNYFGSGMTSNIIQTGKVVFSYSDANGSGNGIYIENASPTPDDMGKMLSGTNEYFDFSVSATTTNTNLAYEITAVKNEESTLEEEYVKIYLTELEGTQEIETPLTNTSNGVALYNQLRDTTNELLTGKTLYFGTVNAGEVAYGKKFRLRMWVKIPENDDYDIINDKTFSVKVNVAATSAH